MEIIKTQQDNSLRIALKGRLDQTTAPDLEKEMASLNGVTDLTLDFSELTYVSSAGLRVLLAMQKIMNVQGNMKLLNVTDEVMEIFEITGFSEILTIE